MSKFLRIILIFVLLSLIHNNLYPSGLKKEEKPEEKRAFEKSLLFPGWGQIHEKQYLKGAIFATAELLAITGIVINNNRGNDSYNKYRDAVNEMDASLWRRETEKFDKKRNIFIAAGIGIWIINMVEIYLFKKKKKKNQIKVSLKKGVDSEILFNLDYSF